MASRIQRKANDDSSLFYEFDLHLPSRTIYCGNSRLDDGDSDDASSAELFVKGMHLLNQVEVGPSSGISVILNHWGGDEYHFLAVYDAIASSPHEITATVFGAAFSMGSWILQAADTRIVSPNRGANFSLPASVGSLS